MSEQHTDDLLSSEGLTEYKYDLHGNLRFKRDAAHKSKDKLSYRCKSQMGFTHSRRLDKDDIFLFEHKA